MTRRRKAREADARKKGSNSPSPGAEGKRRGIKGSLREWVKSILIALLLFFFIKTFIMRTYVIISGSMEDTMLVGEAILVNRAGVGARIPFTHARVPGYAHVERGNIMVFDPPHEENLMLVKRVMGLPGDTLEMKGKVLFVNGEAQREPYVKHTDPGQVGDLSDMSWQRDFLVDASTNGDYTPTRDNWGPIVVPPGQYFMLGDNRDTSLDSRYWGLVERWRFVGRPILVYFSYNQESYRPFPWLREVRWGRIGHRPR